MHAVLSGGQATKFENFQILKYRFINEMLVDAETHVDLKKRSEELLEEIESTIENFKKQGQKFGIDFDTTSRPPSEKVRTGSPRNKTPH